MKLNIKIHGTIVFLMLIIAIPMCNFTEDVSANLITSVYSTLNPTYTSGAKYTVDDSGVPLTVYGQIDGIYVGEQRNPVSISQSAFVYEEKYRNGDENSLQLFLNCTDWLVDNVVQYDNYTIWEYNFPFSYYNMTPPWRSGMAQGQGIEALSKAYNLTGDEKYLNVAKTSLNSFFIDVEDGGVTHKGNEGWWYEEYVGENGDNPRVLNGMIFSLFGIYEYYKLTNDENASILFDNGVEALKYNLPDYDTGGWTYYDALGNVAVKKYHHIHVVQLLQLYEMTGDPIFLEYHNKWRGYENTPPTFFNRAILAPSKLVIAIYLLNFILLFVMSEIVIFSIDKIKK